MFILQNSESIWMLIVSLPILFPNLLSMSLNTPQWSVYMNDVNISEAYIKAYRACQTDEEKLKIWLRDFADNNTFGHAKWPIHLSDFAVVIAKCEQKKKFMHDFIPPIILAQKYFHLNRIFMTTQKEREKILDACREYIEKLEDEEKKQIMKSLIDQSKEDSDRLPKELNSDQEEWCRQGEDVKYLERRQERKQDFWNGEIWYKFQHDMLPISLAEYRKTAEIMRLSAEKKEFDQFILGIFEFFASQGHPKRFEEIFTASPEETKYWNDELDTLDQVRQEVKSIVPPEKQEER